MRFILTIELGNDAMRSPSHVATALAKLRNSGAWPNDNRFRAPDGGKILDVNGNSVGEWKVES